MIRCIITSIGSIMLGQVKDETVDNIMLSNPREVQIMQIDKGQTKFAVLYIFGRPETIIVSKKSILLHYEVKDPSILAVYEEHTSPIHRAKPEDILTLTNRTKH